MLEDMVCVHFTEAEKAQHNPNLLVQLEKGKSEFLLIHLCQLLVKNGKKLTLIK